MDVQPNDPAPQQETPTRVVDRVTEHTIRFETWVGYNSTWKYFKVRASCHVPCCSTPALLCSRTHRTVPVQMWMDETKSSFEMAKAKIDGRDISYPYLLDAKGEPRLQCTNAFMIWFCERCDIVVKKTVVEKAESWLMACTPEKVLGAERGKFWDPIVAVGDVGCLSDRPRACSYGI